MDYNSFLALFLNLMLFCRLVNRIMLIFCFSSSDSKNVMIPLMCFFYYLTAVC